MAIGNLLQGQGSGKVGDVVFMVRQGQQVSRVYTESGARTGKEASEASRIQRVKFGSASNQWGLYRYVSTRMYRTGRTSRQSDYNYFVKKNNLLLPYLTKEENASGVHVLQPGVFSEGNLGRIELLHYYSGTYTAEEASLVLFCNSADFGEAIQYSATMGTLKARMQNIFPGARKVTYLFSVASEVTIQEGGQSFISQTVNHYPVVIDIYDEVTPGENLLTIAQYFSSKVKEATLSSIFDGATALFSVNQSSIYLFAKNESQHTFLARVGVLLFATDDNASDCYTTSLPESNINPTSGVYVDWVGYRTASSLKLAAISYGYQQGVMRDTIASYGNGIGEAITTYAHQLARFSKAMSANYMKSVGDASEVQAKVVRKSAEEE